LEGKSGEEQYSVGARSRESYNYLCI